MRRRFRIRAALTAAATATITAATLGLTAAGASAATAAGRPGGHGLPPHVFAPYFETYDTTDGGLAALSQASGARYQTLAFLQTAQPGSCTAYWNGDPTQPIAASSYGADIAAIQARGGNVIPSFGGYSADTTGTELADSCTSVPAIARVFEQLITTYHVPRIDLDVEADSLSNTAGINRRNEAIALTEAWAAAHHRSIQFSYTLPTFATGLTAAGAGRPAERGGRPRPGQRGQHHDLRLLLRHRAGDGDGHRDRRRGPGQPAPDALPGRQPGPALAHGRRHRDARHRRLRAGRDVHPGRRGHRGCTGRRARASRCCPSGRCNATTAAARAPRARATAPGWPSRPGTSATRSSASPTVSGGRPRPPARAAAMAAWGQPR